MSSIITKNFPSKVAAVAVCSALAMGAALVWDAPVLGAAFAQSNDGASGGEGQGAKGEQAGQGNQGGSGSGQAGPDASSDGKGPQAGAPSSDGSGGGKPVWAKEGIPEVELGRLSVARSPDQVLDRSLAEALATITPEMVDFYNLSPSEMLSELSLNWDNVSLIDSPLQNLALLKDALDGSTSLTDLGVTSSLDTLYAVFLGVASDKTVPISTDTVIAVTTILGTPITGDAAEDLASDAEAIRIAVLAGHG